MKKGFGFLLVTVAVLLYLIGIAALAKELQYSITGLWYTLTDGALLVGFIAFAAGALSPGAVLHYIGYRLLRSARGSAPLESGLDQGK